VLFLLGLVGLRWLGVMAEASFAALVVDVPRSWFWPQRVRLWGFHLYVGNKGQGKTMSIVYALDRLRRQHRGHIDIYTNFGWAYETGPISGPDHIIAAQFANRPTVFAFDEIAQEFQSKAFERLDEEWITYLTQQRKWGECGVLMLGSAQRANMTEVTFRRLADYIIECKSWAWNNRRYVAQQWFAGIEAYMDGHDYANGFKRPREHVREFHASDRLRNQYSSFSRVARLAEIGSDVDQVAKRSAQVAEQMAQLDALRAARTPVQASAPVSTGRRR
jgi:hypothetical protein